MIKMPEKIQLPSFYLEEYQEDNPLHIKLIKELNKDSLVHKHLGSINISIEYTKSQQDKGKIDIIYTAFINTVPFAVIMLNYYEEIYEVSYAVLPEYRNNHLGSSLLQEFSNYILQNYDFIAELTLIIPNINDDIK